MFLLFVQSQSVPHTGILDSACSQHTAIIPANITFDLGPALPQTLSYLHGAVKSILKWGGL